MATLMQITGLDQLIARMQFFPEQLKTISRIAMESALTAIWEAVPPYPPEPEGSTYRRTGTLGRTLGSSEGGGITGGKPDIYTVKSMGEGGFEGHFGTNLSYAPYVIGDESQAWMHRGRWWVIGNLTGLAATKIQGIFQAMADALAQYLEGTLFGGHL